MRADLAASGFAAESGGFAAVRVDRLDVVFVPDFEDAVFAAVLTVAFFTAAFAGIFFALFATDFDGGDFFATVFFAGACLLAAVFLRVLVGLM